VWTGVPCACGRTGEGFGGGVVGGVWGWLASIRNVCQCTCQTSLAYLRHSFSTVQADWTGVVLIIPDTLYSPSSRSEGEVCHAAAPVQLIPEVLLENIARLHGILMRCGVLATLPVTWSPGSCQSGLADNSTVHLTRLKERMGNSSKGTTVTLPPFIEDDEQLEAGTPHTREGGINPLAV
jgi:hypothetical protein